MNGKYPLEFGRKKREDKIAYVKERTYGKGATAILICGALFCALFFASKISNSSYERPIDHSFEAVYAMAQADASVPSDSVLSSTMEDGEWSVWLYLEYVLTKLFGEV